MTPEAKARQTIDALLVPAGWHVCSAADGTQERFVGEIGHHLSIVCEVEAEVDTNLKSAQALRHATLAKAFQTGAVQISLIRRSI